MMESETRKVAATNDSADNDEGGDYGEPSNMQSEDPHLRSLLNALDQEQLVHILVELGMKIPQVAEEIRGAARHTTAHRKLFVFGFGEETTSETLGDAFSSYGEVEDAYVEVGRTTGKSRCFGFITFKSLESVKKALVKPKTLVDGRLAFQQPAPEAQIANADADPRKLFVSRLSSDITTERFLRFFEKYGEIENGYVIYDLGTRKSSGIGYVTFKTVEAAWAAILDPNKIIGSNRFSLEIKRIKKKERKVQGESVSYAPHVHNRPYAFAPQHYGLQSQFPHPHFSGYEPHGIPIAYQPPIGTYQPHFSGYEHYGIPLAYQPPTVAYQPHFSGYEPYGIPLANQPPTIAYQPHFSGYELYGIPPANQPPTVAYPPHFIGYEPYGIRPAYQPPTGAYPTPTGAYRAYRPATGPYQPRTGAYRAYQPPT